MKDEKKIKSNHICVGKSNIVWHYMFSTNPIHVHRSRTGNKLQVRTSNRIRGDARLIQTC